MSWAISCFDLCEKRMRDAELTIKFCKKELSKTPWYKIFRKCKLNDKIYDAQKSYEEAERDWYRLWS